MKKNDSRFENQVADFHHQMVELIKKYQFRDRNQITCCGVSVSQCYIMEALHTNGALTMKQLADKMHLSISTVTRVVEPLVQRRFVDRIEDDKDRRVRQMLLTQAGKVFFLETWQNIFHSERMILADFPAEHRDVLIEFLGHLNRAVENWQACCTT